MNEDPYYTAFPWPWNAFHRVMDEWMAMQVAIHTHTWMNVWFSPYSTLARSADFSDFGQSA